MTAQIKTRTVTYKSVMRTAAFMRGVREAREGLPMDYDAYTQDGDTNNRWQYERGRQFGILYREEVKHEGRVRWQAIGCLQEAMLYNHIR